MVSRRDTGILALALLVAGFVMVMEAHSRAHAPAGNWWETGESAESERPEIMSGE
jgi:hypothetical protein